MLIQALKDQMYKNYELIVIDDYPNRNLKTLIESHGIPVTYYGPMKKKSLPEMGYNQCNVMNTALLYATGDILITYNDYTWVPPTALADWNRKFNERGLKSLISGVGREYVYGGVIHVGDESIFEPPFEKFDYRFTFYHSWIPKIFELFYAGLPIQYLLDINGFDERADEWCVFWFDSVVEQARLNGLKLYVDKDLVAYMINHRIWDFVDSKLWHIVRTGKDRPEVSPTWGSRSMNKFDIKEMRKV